MTGGATRFRQNWLRTRRNFMLYGSDWGGPIHQYRYNVNNIR